MEPINKELTTIRGDANFQKIDRNKLATVFNRNIVWVILLVAINFLAAFLYVRYTKPLFESSSEIKLDREEQAEILGLNNPTNQNNFGILSSEIELIKSRLFFNKVIDAVGLNPQYFTDGNILDDEKYRNPPFRVTYKLKDSKMYDKRIAVVFQDESRYELSYKVGSETFEQVFRLNEEVSTPHIDLVITPGDRWLEGMGEDHYFVINSHESLMNYIESNLEVTPLNLEANTFQISFKDHNFYKAHDMVNAIDTLYYNYSLEEKNQANNKKIEYLNDQLLETEKKLEDLETYFEDFTIENRTVNLDEDVRKTLEVINSLDSQRININNKIDDLNRLKEEVAQESIINVAVDQRLYPPHLINSIQELNLLINEKEKLGISYRENTYTFKARQQEVELLKADVIVAADELIKNLIEKRSDLVVQKARLTSQLTKLPSKSTEYNKAKRFYSLNEEIYLSLMQSKNEFEIAVAGSTTTIKILSPASLSFEQISPNPTIAYGAATASSILLVFIFVGLAYLNDNKINSLKELESLTSVPILGQIPLYKPANGHAELIVAEKPKSVVSESLRSIRTNIEFILPDIESKIISITSTVSSEGKTFLSTNLGGLIAMTGKKCVVLDLDLRKPKVHLAFDHELSDKGISTILIGKNSVSECLTETKISGLEYIAAGPIPPNPSELLLGESFEKLIKELKTTFDVIIFDTPPVGLVTDGLLVMKKADLPIYVFKANYSERSYIDNLNRLADSGQFKHLSVVLNATNSIEGYGYGKKHSYYHS